MRKFMFLMKILVNTRLLLPGRFEGIGWFTHQTLSRIARQHPEHQFFFIFDRPYDAQFCYAENVHPIVAGPPTRHPLLWYIWFEYIIPRLMKKTGADLFLSTDGMGSLRVKKPQLTVIHDINFEHRPEDLRPSHGWYLRRFSKRYAQHATRVATVSNYSRTDLVNTYHIDPKKIDMVSSGLNSTAKPLPAKEIEETRATYCEGKPYFLFIGALHPRKNVAGLLRAFDRFREASKKDVRLMIVGGTMHRTEEINQVYEQMKHREAVHFTGRVSDDELSRLLGAALALTFVPFAEGFGLPLIEAMAAHVPVITSDVTSLPEIGGDAVLKTNPYNPEEIAEAMLTIANNSKRREQLIEKGRARFPQFTWERTATLLWESIMKTIHESEIPC